MEILRRNKVDYVMFAKDSQLTDSLKQPPGFTPVETPSERYDLYAVDLRELSRKPRTVDEFASRPFCRMPLRILDLGGGSLDVFR